jgi:hypothetical protein
MCHEQSYVRPHLQLLAYTGRKAKPRQQCDAAAVSHNTGTQPHEDAEALLQNLNNAVEKRRLSTQPCRMRRT